MQDDNEQLSPDEMKGWLAQEVRELTKALELRLSDATDLVTNYAAGVLTPEQANERLERYMDRWGDSPIPGMHIGEQMSNSAIIEELDGWRTRESERRAEQIRSARQRDKQP